MESNEDKLLESILEKVDAIERFERERSFLSRMDMMFSVLVSLTFFILGLIIDRVRPIDFFTKFLFSVSLTILVLMIYTLVGEFKAILSDDATMRFGYWVVLIWGIFLLMTWGVIGAFSVVLFVAPEPVAMIVLFFFGPIGLLIVFVMIFTLTFVSDLYQRYTAKLCFRGAPKSDGRHLKPTVRGVALTAIFFAMLFFLLQFVFP